jgi:hypothetical protein
MSPDIGDAAALTCLDRYTGDDPAVRMSTPEGRKKQQRKYASMMG